MLPTQKQNWGYKIVAVLCATVLSFYVRVERGPESSPIADTVDIRSQEQGLEYQLGRDTVQVIMQGPSEVLRRTRAADIDTFVEVRGLRPGQHSVPVRCQPVAFPELLRCTPSPPTVTVTVRRRVSERRPVEIRWLGTNPLGYVYEQRSLAPASAYVSGPEDQVEKVKHLVATVTRTGSVIDDTITLLPLDSRGVRVPDVSVSPTHAHVVAALRPQPQSKEVFVTPQLVGRLPAGYRLVDIMVTPSTVEAMGAAEALSGLQVVRTVPLNLGDLTQSTRRRLPLQSLPRVTFGTDTVTVNVVVAPVPREAGPAPEEGGTSG